MQLQFLVRLHRAYVFKKSQVFTVLVKLSYRERRSFIVKFCVLLSELATFTKSEKFKISGSQQMEASCHSAPLGLACLCILNPFWLNWSQRYRGIYWGLEAWWSNHQLSFATLLNTFSTLKLNTMRRKFLTFDRTKSLLGILLLKWPSAFLAAKNFANKWNRSKAQFKQNNKN